MLIFDNRLLWQTVSNAADKSTATQSRGGRVFTSETVLVLSRDEIFVDYW